MKSILIIDDETSNIKLLHRGLVDKYQILAAKSGEAGINIAKQQQPALILLDVVMPNIDGFEVIKRLQNDAETVDIPVIFLTGLHSVENEELGLNLGAQDYINKPFHMAVVRARIATQMKIVEQKEIIKFFANHDALTGLPTLKIALDRLDMSLKAAKRQEWKLAVLYIDLDGFKDINDTFGHDAGDVILKTTARKVINIVRESDTVCRIGGDEIMVIMNNINNVRSLEDKCQRLICDLANTVHYNGNELQVTASIGASVFPDHADTADTLRKKADETMYKVKRSGKNNYMVYSNA